MFFVGSLAIGLRIRGHTQMVRENSVKYNPNTWGKAGDDGEGLKFGFAWGGFPLRCDLLFEDVGLFFENVDHQSIQSNGIFGLSLLTCCLLFDCSFWSYTIWRVVAVVLSATYWGVTHCSASWESAIAGRCIAYSTSSGYKPVPFEPAYVIHDQWLAERGLSTAVQVYYNANSVRVPKSFGSGFAIRSRNRRRLQRKQRRDYDRQRPGSDCGAVQSRQNKAYELAFHHALHRARPESSKPSFFWLPGQ